MTDLKKLKSGSDIRGTASEGVEGQAVELTNEVVEKIISSFVLFISEKLDKSPQQLKISVGNDSRISADRINGCVEKTLCDLGVNVLNCKLISTPAMFMTTLQNTLNCDAAVMITASHHPFNKNGLKFFTKNGGLESSDIEKILDYAIAGKKPQKNFQGKIQYINFIDTYSSILRKKIIEQTKEEQPLKGFKIVVDAGNGAGGFFADKVLKPLGADTEGSQFLEPDGNFPNHVPNPENKQAMDAICGAVINNKADFGIIFDTDVDRAGAVDSDGKEINRNKLIALISAILLEEQKGAYIVTDSITSDGLAEFISSRGGIHHRFKRGYKNVINEAIRLNSEGKYCPLAIETSGHAALKENYFLDDGAYLIVRLLIKMTQLAKEGKKLGDLISDLKMPVEETEIRMKLLCDEFKAYGNMILEKLSGYADINKDFISVKVNYEGLRVSFSENCGDGWFLLRLSLHDPIMPLNIESNKEGGTKIIAQKLYDFLKDFKNLDISPLLKYIS